MKRLEQAGLGLIRQQNPATEKPLERHGVAYSIGSAALEIYIYPSPAARQADQARLEPGEYVNPDDPIGFIHKPTLVTSANLLAILDTRRERQRERITLALTAGPPLPAATAPSVP